MQKIRTMVLAAMLALGIAGVFTAEAAQAAEVQWAGYNGAYHLNGGQYGYTNYDHWMFATNGYSSEQANCSGIVGVGGACAGAGKYSDFVEVFEWDSEAYLYNDSSHGAYFDGWYTYE
jgi:hypothetical protein